MWIAPSIAPNHPSAVLIALLKKFSKKAMKLITHDGTFHYDEVLSTAILEKIYPGATLIRTRDDAVIETGDIVYDVGRVFDAERKRFDHHQRTFEDTYSSRYTIKLSSSGLIYKYYHEKLFELYNFTRKSPIFDYIVEKIYVEFFLPADACDNGVDISGVIKQRTVADVVKNFNCYNASNGDKSEENERFRKAVNFVSCDLHNYLEYVLRDYAINYEYLYNELKDFKGDIYYTEEKVSMDLVYDINEELKKDLKFVVVKNNQDYRILTFPVSKGCFKVRYPLHPDWRGLANEDLDAVSKIPNCIFVHVSGFTGGNRTKEGAFAMCKKSLEYIFNK